MFTPDVRKTFEEVIKNRILKVFPHPGWQAKFGGPETPRVEPLRGNYQRQALLDKATGEHADPGINRYSAPVWLVHMGTVKIEIG